MSAPAAPGFHGIPIDEQVKKIQDYAEQARLKASEAKFVLEQPVVLEAFAVYEQTVWKLWSESKPDETDKRDWLYHQYRAGRAWIDYLTSVIGAGKSASQTAADVLRQYGSTEQPDRDE